MTNFLFAKNKIEFVDGTIKKPEKSSKDYMLWMRVDAMIKGWLSTAMEKNIRDSVKYAATSSEIWADLNERFGKESAPRAYELKQKIASTRQNGNSVSTYFTQLRALWDESQSIHPLPRCSCSNCECNIGKKMIEHQEKERLYEFLMGLDVDFTVIRTQILATKPVVSLGTAYHLVAEDERQRSISGAGKIQSEPVAFKAAQKRDMFTGRNRGKDVVKAGKETDEVCSECKKEGHTREGCFELIGYPEWWPGKKKGKAKAKAAFVDTESCPIPGLTKEDYQVLLKHFSDTGKAENTKPMANMAGKGDETETGEWIVDSGCTEYITHMSNALINKRNTPFEPPVVIPNGESIPIQGKGNHVLPGGIKIDEVLYVPDFNFNLLSVSRLTRDLQCSMTFFPDFFIMQGLQRRNLIGVGRCRKGLYRMKMVQERKAMFVNVETWHKRLGHASKEKLNKLDFLKTSTINLGNFCDSCARSKHTRLPFPSSFIKTVAPFDLVHCDVWGGYRVPSYTGANYFLTLVDDFSRAIWIFLLKHKSDASKRLQDFHKMVEVQFKKQIKRIRCDNGGEFTSGDMMEFYNKKGILLETSCPHTPQQNGVVERKHRHLLETARALRFEANLPKRFWGECVLTAAYIINRLPSKVLKNKTPYELIWDEKPDYGILRIFGCLVFFKNNNTKGDKFEERGKSGVFLGYPPGTKGYKILDLKTRKIVVSRDVHFHEEIFPFKTMQNYDEIFEEPQIHHDCSCEPIPNESLNEQSAQPEAEPNSEMGPEMAPVEDETETQPNDEVTHNVDVVEPQTNARPARTKTQPSKLKDFVVQVPPSVQHPTSTSNQVASTVSYPISNFVSYKNFSTNHMAFLTAITQNDEPKSFKQASQDARWREAMQKEIKALEKNGTWSLENLPKGKRAIDSKWVYKIKYKPNGEVERYKARLVAKGFTQMEGVDYHDTFAPVAKLVTVRTLLAIAVKRDWIIHQLDVNNAFLHGDLDEEVYMKIPQGFSNNDETRVCRLRKSLYGLKQASRNWYHKFATFLVNLNFRQSKADHSLFLYNDKSVMIVVLIYVDDVIITGNCLTKIQEVKTKLDHEFSIKDLGVLKYFLGIEVARTNDGLVLSQRKYVLDILKDSGKLGCKPSSFPIEHGLKLDKGEKEQSVDANQYRRLIGRLLYLQATRPDITYTVNILSQFVADPRSVHLEAADRVLRYLKATPGQGILLARMGDPILTAYCDSDWLGCPYTRRSRTGYILLLGGSPISWKTKKQSVVSRSSAEAEYRAMASTISEVLWVRWLLSELQVPVPSATSLFCDNQAARHIANNPVFHERTKHVEMDCYFVRERVESNEVVPMRVSSKFQLADLLTKGLTTQQHQFLLGKIGMTNLHASS